MHRVDHPSAVNELFVEESIPQGQAGTVVPAAWANAVQEEIAAVIETVGLTLNPGDNTQLDLAFRKLAAAHGTDNALFNGDFELWQRGESYTFTSGSRGSIKDYCADRWHIDRAGATPTVSKQTHPADSEVPGSHHFLRWSQGGTGCIGNGMISQQIETVHTFERMPIVVSFWIRDTTGNSSNISVRATQNFGSGGSPNAPQILTMGNATYGTTWQRLEFKGVLPSTDGRMLGTDPNSDYLDIQILTPAGISGLLLDIDRIKIEVGTIATDFIPVAAAVEITRCNRYFYKTYEGDVEPGENDDISFPNRDFGMIETRFSIDASESTDVCLHTMQEQLPVPMRVGATDAERSWYGEAGALNVLRIEKVSDDTKFSLFTVTSVELAGTRSTGAPCAGGALDLDVVGEVVWSRAHLVLDCEYKA